MNDIGGYDIEDLRPGMHATYSKTITEADIVLFAGVSGDNNAVHTNEEFARTTPFGGRIAHGFLTASVISAAVANRLPYRTQCEFMLEDGAWPEDVDSALVGFGFAMGPFAVADLSGLDIAWRMRAARAATRDPRERYVTVLDRLCEQGRLGRKSGRGYYVYSNDQGGGKQARSTDADVRAVIEQASADRGITRRTLAPDEIVRRALMAMVNEAALLLAEGVAQRATDIDVVLVQGYGFPRWQGGPVFWARQQARASLDADLQRLGEAVGFGFVAGDLSRLLEAPAPA